MKLVEVLKRSFVVLMLSFMAVGMLAACSSSEEESSSSGGGEGCEDCSQYSGSVDIAECETRNAMRDGC